MRKLFQKRRSIRRYKKKEISNEKIDRILEAARWTPSAHNAQPWRFLIIKKLPIKLKLAKTMAKMWERDMKSDGFDKGLRRKLAESSINRFTTSPVLILVCLTMKDMKKYPDKRRKAIEHIMAIQSVAAAIENILLATELEGLGACWLCAPLFCKDVVIKTLGLQNDMEPQALITIGYSDEKTDMPKRLMSEEILL
jgi:coenzyme F420-0:L-glutamate ligase/coenzyme F420-1:gamma-L-glutamate ligase